MIDQNTIQRIFDTVDVYEIISDFVSLKKRGVNYVGCCPFHNEKTGSFTVSPSKGIYKCFGCGKGGNAVNFIMEHEQMSYAEALRYLANRYNIPIAEEELSEEKKREKSERESMLIVTNYAHDFFVQQLLDTDEGKSVGLGYLKRRGMDEATIRKFGLGYSPESWDAFTKAALSNGYKKEFLIKTGLSIETEKGIFDRFRARVLFPIRDIAGKVIAFGGRIMTNDSKAAKYLNSPESDIYHKSRTLYGIYFAKKSIIQQNRCYLVEGYLDVISFHTKGIENTVASSGTSLTVEQIRLIRRLSPNITIIYDGDAAGIKASLRGIDLVLEEGLNVKVVSLPPGEDPDSFAQKLSAEELVNYIRKNETDFISFKAKLLLEQSSDDPIERAKLISDIIKSISLIPDNITRSVYIRETASIMQVEEHLLYDEISRLRKEKTNEGNYRHKNLSTPQSHPDTRQIIATEESCEIEERVLIRYLLLYGTHVLGEEEQENAQSTTVGEYIIQELTEDELEMIHPLFARIKQDYQTHCKQKDFVPTRFFSSHSDPEISNIVAHILSDPYELSKIWKEKEASVTTEDMLLTELLPKIVNSYKMRRVEIMAKEVDNKILELQKSEEQEKLLEWLRRKTVIDQIRTKLNKKLGRTGIR